MRKGMMRGQGGGGRGATSTDWNPEPGPKDKDNKIGKAACAERLTSVDIGQKRRIFAPKAFQNPAGYITDQEGASKTL